MLAAIVLATVIMSTHGHGAIVHPPSRNAIDKDLAPWDGPVPNPVPGVKSWCPIPLDHADGKSSLSGSNGQACFWFSNGCTIGCPACDGTTRGPIPNQPKFRHKENVCPGQSANATVCDPKYRTVNTGAECGAPDDCPSQFRGTPDRNESAALHSYGLDAHCR